MMTVVFSSDRGNGNGFSKEWVGPKLLFNNVNVLGGVISWCGIGKAHNKIPEQSRDNPVNNCV